MVDLRNLIEIKKQKKLTTEDLGKIKIIEDILKEEAWMFKLKMDTVIGILLFLDVPENEVMDIYSSLISPENYMKLWPKERI